MFLEPLRLNDDIRELIETPGGTCLYIFRGQADEEWDLKPSLLRSSNIPPGSADWRQLDRDDFHELENRYLKYFRSSAYNYLPPYLVSTTTDCLGWWSIMQHFGFPTRLLDWSRSFFVAVYFAVRERLNRNGVVWVLPVTTLHDETNRRFERNKIKHQDQSEEQICSFLQQDQESMLLETGDRGVQFSRVRAQQGVFTYAQDVLKPHDLLLKELLGSEEPKSFIIRKEDKLKWLRVLDSMNINADNLFPGIEGMAQWVRDDLLRMRFGN